MAGNTLFRPEDRLAWYADWLKFLQEREADLRAQLTRQEKSARKVEAPPEAGIAFVSDQPASYLQIAFGEQAGADKAVSAQPPVDEAGSGGSAEADSAAVLAAPTSDSGDEEAQDDAVTAATALDPVTATSDDEPIAVEEDAVPLAEEPDLGNGGSLSPSPSLPVSGSPSLPLSPSPTAVEPPPKEDLA